MLIGIGEFPIVCNVDNKFAVIWEENEQIYIKMVSEKENNNSYLIGNLDKGESLVSVVYWKSKNIIVLGVDSGYSYFKLYYINEFTLELLQSDFYKGISLVDLFYSESTNHLIIVGYSNKILTICYKKDNKTNRDTMANFNNISSFPFIIKDQEEFIIIWNDTKLNIIIYNNTTKEVKNLTKETDHKFNYLIGTGTISNFYVGGYSLGNGILIYNFEDQKFKNKIRLQTVYMASPELILNGDQLLISIDRCEAGSELVIFENNEIKNSGIDIINFSQIRFVKGVENVIVLGVELTTRKIFAKFVPITIGCNSFSII